MDHNTDKHIEKLVDKMMKETSLETPSFDFTNKVMDQVLALSSSKATVYKPLISKKGWVLISLGIIAITCYIIFGVKTESSGFMDTIDFSILSNNKITDTLSNLKAPSVSIPKTFGYALMLLGLMVCIQIPFLKHYLNQRYKV
ncbi:hypothetical protein GCM10007962_19300 [Yeosuana aromativorans]|uniref:Uncharacterized protein n=1 Tax=Yeosuana aromativorans TaxID=288019 RepID=A0A8J3BMI4_9FLAO|nr:hypothetical protein [Yeosuana aromativorans]GGK25207.1 hypothetical protein GCM10007962_19300 [Yeosuana aromativorans]